MFTDATTGLQGGPFSVHSLFVVEHREQDAFAVLVETTPPGFRAGVGRRA